MRDWWGYVPGWGAHTRTCGHARPRRSYALGALLAFLSLAACGARSSQPALNLPQGTYTSATYHFSISYPAGWQANVAPDGSQIIPLTLLITRTSDRQAPGSLIATLTIAVFNLSNPAMAASTAQLRTDPTKHHVTIAGLMAYASAPTQQQVPGTTATDTHVDYYLIHGGYEYQLSTDAVSRDHANAALSAMLASFKILP